MEMNEPIIDSGVVAERGRNGNGHGHMVPRPEDPYQAAYDAGLASGREAAYRQGYQAGFADGLKQLQGSDSVPASAAPKRKTAEVRVGRLRGLPCPKCGIWLYNDETCCPCCGTPKTMGVARGEQPS
jgi:hypothetical protein